MTPEEWNAMDDGAKLKIKSELSELGKAACEYADLGFAIFPLAPKSKVPAINGGFLNAVASWEDAAFWWHMHPECNIGIATGDKSGLLVIDVDADKEKNKYGDECLFDWEQAHGKLPETACVNTPTGGQHLYFKSDGLPGTNNQTLCIDIKANGGYVVAPPSVHPKGGEYYWDFTIEENGICPANEHVMELYQYVMGGDGVQDVSIGGDAGNGRYSFPEVVNDGEGREHHLFTMACSLRSQGMDYDAILAELRKLNNERVKPPKPDGDLKRMAKSACKHPSGLSPEYQKAKERSEERKKLMENAAKSIVSSFKAETIEPPDPAAFMDKRKFLHAQCAHDMVKRYHARFIDGALSVWNGLHYVSDPQAVERLVCLYRPESTEHERKEVLKMLALVAPKVSHGSSNLIAFNNCILDWKTGETVKPSPELNITNSIPHAYNPDAKSDVVLNFVGDISRWDEKVMNNILEMMGLCITRDTTFGRLFLIINRVGSNGKSTFINFVKRLIGEDNYSAVDMATLGERFQTVPMIGKLANVGDDIPAEFVNGKALSVLKRTVFGDTVPYEIKGGISSDFNPYCTIIYTMNKMPEIKNIDGGFVRRIHPVEFAAHFTPETPGFDPRISEKLNTEEAYEAAILYALDALRRIEENNGPTQTEYQQERIRTIIETSDPIGVWLDEFTVHALVGHSVKWAYDSYNAWVEDNGWHKKDGFSSAKFKAEIVDRTGMYVTDKAVKGQPKLDGSRKMSFHMHEDAETIQKVAQFL